MRDKKVTLRDQDSVTRNKVIKWEIKMQILEIKVAIAKYSHILRYIKPHCKMKSLNCEILKCNYKSQNCEI